MTRFRTTLPFGLAFYVTVVASAAAIWAAPLPFKWALPVDGKTHHGLTEHLEGSPEINTDEMVARPLFMAGRRPVRIAAPVSPAPRPVAIPVPSTDGIFLVGTILADGRKRALIRCSTPPSTSIMEPGQSIGPWTIETIDIDNVRLRTGSHIAVLKFSSPQSPRVGRIGPPMPPAWPMPPMPPFPR